MKVVPLGEVVKFTGGGTPSRDRPEYWGGSIPWVSCKDLNGSLSLYAAKETITDRGLESSASNLIPPQSLLVATRMSLGKAVINEVPVAINQDLKAAICSPVLYVRYLLWFWLSQAAAIARMGSGATVKGVTLSQINELKIPLPSLEEQKRIAAILDKADAIRRKREQAIKLADEFLRSLFLDMFGDPVRNPKGWETVRLADLLRIPLRNGISPSSDGTFTSRVLTLSAITGRYFDSKASKVGVFAEPIRPEKYADARDLLVCRGNGNLGLVGRGKFPTDVVGIAFPDTMIAARINDRCEPQYITAIWDTPCIRKQIENGARTTNGTFKVNQQLLESIVFPVPPIKLQRVFSNAASTLLGVKDAMRHQSETDLIASLSQRAFRGEL